MGESSAPGAGTHAADAGTREATKVPGPREAQAARTAGEPGEQGSGGVLGCIERVGNKVPHPAMIFLILCASSSCCRRSCLRPASRRPRGGGSPPTHEPGGGRRRRRSTPDTSSRPRPSRRTTTSSGRRCRSRSLLTGDGIRFMFTSTVDNFNNFGVVGVILVAMIGVGVAEEAGLIGALIRKLVSGRHRVRDHVHHRPGRHPVERRLRRRLPGADPARRGRVPQPRAGNPMAGIAAAFAGVGATFGGQHPDHADRRDRHRDHQRGDAHWSTLAGRSTSPRTSTSASARRSSSRSSSRPHREVRHAAPRDVTPAPHRLRRPPRPTRRRSPAACAGAGIGLLVCSACSCC